MLWGPISLLPKLFQWLPIPLKLEGNGLIAMSLLTSFTLIFVPVKTCSVVHMSVGVVLLQDAPDQGLKQTYFLLMLPYIHRVDVILNPGYLEHHLLSDDVGIQNHSSVQRCMSLEGLSTSSSPISPFSQEWISHWAWPQREVWPFLDPEVKKMDIAG